MKWILTGALVCSLLAVSRSWAQVTVTTLGGGPTSANPSYSGYANGNTLNDSQFHSPYGCAVDSAGNLYVADRDNGAVRLLDLAKGVTTTYLSGFDQPVAVAFDPGNNLYILSQGDGTLVLYDIYGNGYWVATNLASPTAMALDALTNIYVTEAGGTVKMVNATNLFVSVVATGLSQPEGVTVLPSGYLAVSEAGSSTLRVVDPATGATVQRLGTSGPGFRDGLVAGVQFSQPWQLAAAPNGVVVVVDRGNNRVRLWSPTGIVTTLYGTNQYAWVSNYPGWEDGPVDHVEARDPVGVAVARDGTVYTTEDYYHIVRKVTGANLGPGGAGGTGPGGTNGVVNPPVISPNAGYFPMGQLISVTSSNSSVFFPSTVYYTTDGSEPTTNSRSVQLTNNAGVIPWHASDRTLASLRVKTFLGATPSVTVSGQSVANSEVGIHRDVQAGVGARVIIPVVVNMQSNGVLRSVQFLVQFTPESPAAPPLLNLATLSSTNEPFVPVLLPGGSSQTNVVYNAIPYASGATSGLIINYLGTNNLLVQDSAVVALVEVPVPPTAHLGDRYQMLVTNVSGTSDGIQSAVFLTNMVPRELILTNRSYLVGDCSPGGWYNAGDFGDNLLNNSDVNSAYFASLGVRVPYQHSDLFDAMDAFPLDSTTVVGGDGQIRFLDWQVILLRSLRLETNAWRRSWGPAGQRTVVRASSNFSPDLPSSSQAAGSNNVVWFREALIGAQTVANVTNTLVNVPIYAQVRPGYSVSGLQFRVVVSTTNALALTNDIQFVPDASMPTPDVTARNAVNDASWAWSLGRVSPPLQGTNMLGVLQLKIPALIANQNYTVRFANFDAASGVLANPNTWVQYDCESLPGTVWIGTPALALAARISDEWKTNFFGSYSNPLAAEDADPDGDGVPNLAEYQAGTNPAKLHLHVLNAQWRSDLGAGAGFLLRWFGAGGASYAVESASPLAPTNWSPLSTNILGGWSLIEIRDANLSGAARFYRVRRQ